MLNSIIKRFNLICEIIILASVYIYRITFQARQPYRRVEKYIYITEKYI